MSTLKILILCNPCHGFGDVIFAIKLMGYIRDWYGAKVKIATTDTESFIKVGAVKKDIIALDVKRIKQCRRFGTVQPRKPIGKFDLFFVAPLPADNTIIYSDISKLCPFSNKKNTIFFSEYNDRLDKGFHFNTGVGRGRDGIFLTKVPKTTRNKSLGKYALSYLSNNIVNAKTCFLAFLQLVTTKYKYTKFSVLAPSWVASEIKEGDITGMVSSQYKKIVLHTQNEKIILLDEDSTRDSTRDSTHTLHIRCDIFPVPNADMIALMKYSVADILLTGDQSVTDMLSCCSRKNLFYQIAPWKENFARNLAKEIQNSFLSRKRTSCGTIKALEYKSDYRQFVKKWDFRNRGKAKLDAIIQNIVEQ